MKLAMVEWLDSCAYTGWELRGDLSNCVPSKCVTVGMVKERDDATIIVQSISESGCNDNVLTVPRCAVIRIRYLKVK